MNFELTNDHVTGANAFSKLLHFECPYIRLRVDKEVQVQQYAYVLYYTCIYK